MNLISKKNQQLINSLHGRHGRKKSDYCVCEGIKACRELVETCPELIECGICVEGFDHSAIPYFDFATLHNQEFEKISNLVHSEGVVFIARRPKSDKNTEPVDPFILVLDKISDPGNLGTIIRTARATGLKDIWITKGTSDPFSPKTIRAALGLQFGMKIYVSANLADAIQEIGHYGYKRFYRTVPKGGNNLFSEGGLFQKTAIIFGNESHGVSKLSNSLKISIPMPGPTESLNVAQSVTIVLFEYIRRLTTNRS